MSLATIASMREVASLTDATLSGTVADGPCTSALRLAVLEMRKETSDYDDVAALDEDDPKRISYVYAESAFAISKLPKVLTGTQLASTGIVAVLQRGTERRELDQGKIADGIEEKYRTEAFNFLRDHSAVQITDSNGTQIGVKTKNRKFSMMGI